MASEEQRERLRKATLMGLNWGLRHGTTMVLVGRYLPERVQTAAEVAVGAIVVLLAARLLLRWRRGAHAHEGGEEHRHRHSHALHRSHEHTHDATLRTRLSAYGVGLVHAIGGSGGLTLLLLSTACDPAEAMAALFVFALGTALSIALLSTASGLVIAAGPVARSFERVAPVLSVLSVAFGL
jgi:cytochrome c biogenesis protein CcdA